MMDDFLKDSVELDARDFVLAHYQLSLLVNVTANYSKVYVVLMPNSVFVHWGWLY